MRPVSALMSEDLPTFERPAKAISGGADRRQAVRARSGEKEIARTGEQLSPGLRPVSSASTRHTLGVLAGAFANSLVRLSHSSTFTPAFLMM